MGLGKRKSSSPLGRHLNNKFGGKKRFGKKRAIFGAVMIVLVPYIGTSLAASVAINGRGGSGAAIEFAQGSQTTIVCDSTITTELDSSYSISDNYFKVDTITLSGVNTTSAPTASASDSGCGGKKLTITVYKTVVATTTTTSLATIGNSSATSVTFTVPTSTSSITPEGSTGITASATIASATTGIIVLTLPSLTPPLNASEVSRVGIETS
jgi:hypothetical protein